MRLHAPFLGVSGRAHFGMRKFAYRNLLFIRWMEVHRTVHIDDLVFCGYFVKTIDETNLPNPLASMDLLLPTVPVHVKARPYTL